MGSPANGSRGAMRSLFPNLEEHLHGARRALTNGLHLIDRRLEHISGQLQNQEGPESQRLQRSIWTPAADGVVTFVKATLDVPAGWHWHVTHVAIGQTPIGANTPCPGLLFRDSVAPDNLLVAADGGGGAVTPGDESGTSMWVGAKTTDFTVEARTRLILYLANQAPPGGPLAPNGLQAACTLYGSKIRNQEDR